MPGHRAHHRLPDRDGTVVTPAGGGAGERIRWPGVVVVGAGVTGLLVTERLRRSGVPVLLVEQRGLGAGQTGHCHGYLHRGYIYHAARRVSAERPGKLRGLVGPPSRAGGRGVLRRRGERHRVHRGRGTRGDPGRLDLARDALEGGPRARTGRYHRDVRGAGGDRVPPCGGARSRRDRGVHPPGARPRRAAPAVRPDRVGTGDPHRRGDDDGVGPRLCAGRRARHTRPPGPLGPRPRHADPAVVHAGRPQRP